jgi:Domain of unknown function (DUF5753)
VLSGLLQTNDYARALLLTYPGVTDDQVTARLERRMERQRHVLARDDPPDTWFVVDQMALYRQVGSPEIMAAQMTRLAEIARLPHVKVQVLPAVAHPANASGFMIADDARCASTCEARSFTPTVNPFPPLGLCSIRSGSFAEQSRAGRRGRGLR